MSRFLQDALDQIEEMKKKLSQAGEQLSNVCVCVGCWDEGDMVDSARGELDDLADMIEKLETTLQVKIAIDSHGRRKGN